MSCACVPQEKVRLGGQEAPVPKTSESQSLNTSTGSCGPVPSWGQGASLSAFGVFLCCYRTAGPSRGGPDQVFRFGLQSALARLSWRSHGRAAPRDPTECGRAERGQEVPAAAPSA